MLRPAMLLVFSLAAAGCAHERTASVSAGSGASEYTIAEGQARELGPVLAGVRDCDGVEAHDAVFLEFMAAKRRQGFDGRQTAMIATLVGAYGGLADAQTLECSPSAASHRAALIDGMRERW